MSESGKQSSGGGQREAQPPRVQISRSCLVDTLRRGEGKRNQGGGTDVEPVPSISPKLETVIVKDMKC